jgi:KaiC/GvpD/RAD55 family RecA-like ATPase
MTERISTGIAGLDKITEGGLIKGSSALITGAAGTGKTTVAMHFMADGAKRGEKCVFICLEQEEEDIKRQAKKLGQNLDTITFISAEKVKYGIGKKPDDMEEKVKLIEDACASIKPDRVVVDSISALQMEAGTKTRIIERRLLRKLKKLGSTVEIVGESEDGDMPNKELPFLSDAVFVLHYLVVGVAASRTLFIQKMRETKHSESVHPIEITKKGLIVKAAEDAYRV